MLGCWSVSAVAAESWFLVAVVLKSSKEIEKMRRAGQVVREVLELVRSKVKPGATTFDLEKAAEARLKRTGRKGSIQGLSRVSLRAVHLGQQRSGARHSVAEAGAERRRHCFGRLRRGGGRLLRRRGDHGAGGRDRREGRAAAEGDGRVAAGRHCGSSSRARRWAMWARRCRG